MKRLLVASLVLLLTLAGCGGGGGSDSGSSGTTVTGVAAAGAPLAGYVSLKDSLGAPDPALTTLLDADGHFSFDVAGLTPPFFLKAEGVAGNTGYELHSIVGAPGRANVNPLTEAMVAVATGKAPSTVYAAPQGYDATTLSEALEKAATDLMAMLKPLLDAYQVPTLNPVTDVFVADGTGLDALFDGVQITSSGTEIEAVDLASGGVIMTAPIASTTSGLGTVTTNQDAVVAATAVASDFTQIKAFLGQWLTKVKTVTAKFATDGYVNQQAAIDDLTPYYDEVGFGINNGDGLDGELAGMLEDYQFLNAITGISGVSVAGKRGDGAYLLSLVLTLQDQGPTLQFPIVNPVVVINLGTATAPDWRVTGNGYLSDTEISFTTSSHVFEDQTNTVISLDFDLEAAPGDFDSATVTGPGLPSGGLVFTSNPSGWQMQINESDMACIHYEDVSKTTCTTKFWARDWNNYPLADATITAMPQVCTYIATYTDSTGINPSEVSTVTIAAKPLLSTQLTDAHFGNIGNLNSLTSEWVKGNLLGKTYNYQYSTPTAFQPVAVGIEAWINYSDGTVWNYVENWHDFIPLGSSLSAALPLSGVPNTTISVDGEVELWSVDAAMRHYSKVYNFRPEVNFK